jgi:hypothetical protein
MKGKLYCVKTGCAEITLFESWSKQLPLNPIVMGQGHTFVPLVEIQASLLHISCLYEHNSAVINKPEKENNGKQINAQLLTHCLSPIFKIIL